MLIAIDHGNKQIKTVHAMPFTSGLIQSDALGFGTDYLAYQGKYYALTDQRIPYRRDKTEDERFFILTLFAIAYEIEATEQYSDNLMRVQLAVGLPPAHFGVQAKRFTVYFEGRGAISFQFHGKAYAIFIESATCFPQSFSAAAATIKGLASIPKVLVVDIGGGTSDIAVISLSGVVESASIKVAGDQFNEAVVKYMRRKHNILIGERTAEQMKMEIGCVYPKEEEATIEIKGRCLMTGLPKTITVNSTEMMEAFEEPVERILEAVHNVLERTPPELVADISNNGIVMTGGGSLVDGFDKLITARTGIHTVVAEDAISCVAEGTGKSLDSLGDMQDGTVNLSRRRQMN